MAFNFGSNFTEALQSTAIDTNEKAKEEPSTAFRILLVVIVVPLIIETVLGNFLVMIAWLISPSVRTPSNAYLVSLAFVDFLIGLFNMTLGLKYMFDGKWTMSVSVCQFWLTSACSLSFISGVHLTLVALDRHKIVHEGASFRPNRPFSGACQGVLATWVLGIWLASPFLLDWENVSLDPKVMKICYVKSTILGAVLWTSISFTIPASLMIWLYVRIYCQLRRHWKNRTMAQIITISEYSTASVSEGGGQLTEDKRLVNSQRKQWNAAITLGILIAINIICWTPFVVTTFMFAFKLKVHNAILVLCIIMGWINSAVNPVVYAVRNKKFQDAFKRILNPFKKY